MAKLLTVMPAILMLLWPILGASASGEYFYNSVTPADDRAIARPLADPAQCQQPPAAGTVSVDRTMAFEVNGTAYCGGGNEIQLSVATANTLPYVAWSVSVASGTKVKVRYANRDTTGGAYTCLSSEPMFLFLDAPAMGVRQRFLNGEGQWTGGMFGGVSFRNSSPPTNVWNDLYDDVPPKGDYFLIMGCYSPLWGIGQKFGAIKIGVE